MASPLYNLLTSMPPPLHKLTILLFYADRYQLKEAEGIENQIKSFSPEMDCFKINMQLHPKMSESFHVRETPLILFLHNGKEVWRQFYPIPDAELLNHLGHKQAGRLNEVSENE